MSDMKETIAKAALTLLIDQRVKRLTVKDIVEKCSITRQAFYYHFEDIPDLFQWMLKKQSEPMISEILSKDNIEDALYCFFVTAVHMVPYIKKSMDSRYHHELEQQLRQYVQRFFIRAAESKGYYEYCTVAEVKVISRYHTLAILGLLQEWTDQDSRQLDQIVHTVYRLIVEGIPPQIE